MRTGTYWSLGREHPRSLMSGFLLGAAFLLCHANAAYAWPPEGGRGACMVTKTADMPAKMRDGTILRADVYRPQTKKRCR